MLDVSDKEFDKVHTIQKNLISRAVLISLNLFFGF